MVNVLYALSLLLIVAMGCSAEDRRQTASFYVPVAGPHGAFSQVAQEQLYFSSEPDYKLQFFYWNFTTDDVKWKDLKGVSTVLWWSIQRTAALTDSRRKKSESSYSYRHDDGRNNPSPLLLRWTPDTSEWCPDNGALVQLMPRVFHSTHPVSHNDSKRETSTSSRFHILGLCQHQNRQKETEVTVFLFVFSFNPAENGVFQLHRSFQYPVKMTPQTGYTTPRFVVSAPTSGERRASFSVLDTIFIYRNNKNEIRFMGIFQPLEDRRDPEHLERLSILRLNAPWLAQVGDLSSHPHFLCYNPRFHVGGMVWSDQRGYSVLHLFLVNPFSGTTTALYAITTEALGSEDLVKATMESGNDPDGRAFRSCEFSEKDPSGENAFYLTVRVHVSLFFTHVAGNPSTEIWETRIRVQSTGETEVETPFRVTTVPRKDQENTGDRALALVRDNFHESQALPSPLMDSPLPLLHTHLSARCAQLKSKTTWTRRDGETLYSKGSGLTCRYFLVTLNEAVIIIFLLSVIMFPFLLLV